MYQNKKFEIDYHSVESYDALQDVHKTLVDQAKQAANLAYAPYSKFHVGAAIELENGSIVLGSNKENASFPAGICAERNALNYASDHFPGKKIVRLAVYADPKEFELKDAVSPCGVCRQVMAEYERLQKQPYEIILASQGGEIIIMNSAASLLPLHFYLSQLKK